MQIAIGSADEMRVWSRYCLDLEHIDEAKWQRWRDEYQAIAKIAASLVQELEIAKAVSDIRLLNSGS